MTPAFHRRLLDQYVEAMVERTDQVTAGWAEGQVVDMLVEMRKVALLILLDALYCVDFTPELNSLWDAILASIRYISPGLWMMWGGVPRPGYKRALRKMDDYLYRIIGERRRLLETTSQATSPNGPGQDGPRDLLGLLIGDGLDDDLIRDQLLTMLIAGHDTSTALLAWGLYLLGSHPTEMLRARREVDSVLGLAVPCPGDMGRLEFLGRAIKEALRLYPPIHLGSRLAAADLNYADYHIPAGERVIYSIYLTQRHSAVWPDPHRFYPDRHTPGGRQAPYAWLAFGGGPRNCIGAGFGLLEAKVVLARLLQTFDLALVEPHVHPHMGATLEPRPGVRMRVQRRFHLPKSSVFARR